VTNLAEALSNLDEDKVYKLVDEKIMEGEPPINIIEECSAGVTVVGERFAKGEYYLTELMFSAEILQQVMKKLKLDKQERSNSLGTVVIGTVKDDIHDIGKNIVVSMLRSNGFKVIDLGVDVHAKKFVEAIKESGAKVLGLSALLNNTYPQMKNVVEAFIEAGIREQITIVIGGAVCNEKVREYTGADYYARDVIKGVDICKKVYS
jgi:methylmalonyl-CoA mutase cobalamin-binding domain/chain